MLKLSDFDYSLPKELIAQYPLKERGNAKLMVLDRSKQAIEHRIFKDITEYLKKGDLIIVNDTRVLPSRLKGRRASGGKVEVLLLKQKSGPGPGLTFNALIKPSRVRTGEKIIFNGGKTYGIITDKNEIYFSTKDKDSVYNLGSMPLPPYIKREPEDLDNLYYQTVYAKNDGSVASPTAGLHFTQDLLKRIESCGINIAYITLHVGIGTFRPIKAEDITRHKMEPEYFTISDEAAAMIDKAHREKRRIICVGTTTLRALETYHNGIKQGYTDLFIYTGHKFNIADCLLTNFHLPRTTLFMLVDAFAGEKFIKKAYQEAIDNKYRFYSYGDAMLII